jgi:hypothetical protein
MRIHNNFFGKESQMDTKQWYLSKTVWASILTVLLAILAMTGVTHIGSVQVDQVAAEQESILDGIVQMTLVVSGLVALYGRLTAKTKIGTP